MNRVLIDGMKSFPRVIYPLRRLTLTKLRVPGVLRGTRTGNLVKLCKEFNMERKWTETKVCQKMDRYNKRTTTTDFDRF